MPFKGNRQLQTIGERLKSLASPTPRSSNLAVTRDGLTLPQPPLPVVLLQQWVSRRKGRCTLVWARGPRLVAVASARMRTGIRAWEIDKLYLPANAEFRTDGSRAEARSGQDEPWRGDRRNREPAAVEVLEALTLNAGSRGAERVFLRIPLGSTLADIAPRSGFFPYFQETLLQSRKGDRVRQGGNSPGLRPKLPHEDYHVFQLYSAATPSAVRFGTGMTLGQWTDSRERVGNRAQEEVYEVEGRIMAWLGSDLGGCIAHMELMIDPDYQEMLGPMMDHALAGHGIQSWLVPEYQNTLRNSLIYRGFVEVAHYIVLIKTMAARVNRPSVAHVEARVW